MGEMCSRTPDSWGVPLTELFEHRLVTFLNEADVPTLGREESAAVLYDELRSFMALQRALNASDPPETLRPASEALAEFAARLFKAAHQALLNHGQKDQGAAAPRRREKGQHGAVAPTMEFLLQWQLVRMKVARRRLVMELADVSLRDEELYQSLALPEGLGAEVETVRMRLSDVWKELPDWPWESSRGRDTPARLAG